ncbi:MAG TPA: ATP-binding protein [Phnomibacter sp.]|nr:ATP-binding protein [Phnomibacter sp.]
MIQALQNILDLLTQLPQISDAERSAIEKFVKDADKQLAIAEFKLDRTEKVKRTTAILLEETIEELEQKRKAIEDANVALQKSLEELKAAQAQLIQAEKMASLGELTAGIAHEIQNPLNFVNNFSEVSQELIGEMNDELAVGNYEFAKEIASDIEQNLVKIHHHGKRADAIVKGMLQHSRTGTGQKEPTNINALVEEYLRLSYHGLRARDRSFNADMKMDLDPAFPKIELVQQDIGRVILNLFTNAFYAVHEKQKKGSSDHKPTVWISTKVLGKRAMISVRDNGDGIPDSVKDKIFQPFFTTKPTGEGTGLGLSLSYDIIKAHGGELTVASKVGEGATFTISLPLGP